MKSYSENISYNKLEVSPTGTTQISSSTEMYIRDWRKALRTPPSYRIGNRTIRLQVHFIWILASFSLLIFIFFYIKPASKSSYLTSQYSSLGNVAPSANALFTPNSNIFYNSTYPLSSPFISNGISTFRIGIIADLDTNSRSQETNNVWRSYYKKGYLSYSPAKNSIVITWDANNPIEIVSSFALKGRGMELSELVVFNGKLLTFDDRTGFVYEIDRDKAIPWVLLMDGDGKTRKGFKSEWATVKDQVLYIGSMGKEWTTSMGEFENYDPMYVKAVTIHGEVYHLNWMNNYKAIRSAMGIEWPGYMIHESGVWSDEHRKWYFLPRRCSKEHYNETRDEHMGCNVLISADENFSSVKVVEIKGRTSQPTHGYSSFKFLPNTNDKIIVALSTEELNGKTSTYVSAFSTINGEIFLEEEKVPTEFKYEGFEFI